MNDSRRTIAAVALATLLVASAFGTGITSAGISSAHNGASTSDALASLDVGGVDVQKDCVNDQGELTGELTLTNNNDILTVSVALQNSNGDIVDTVELAPGEEMTISGLDDGEYTVLTSSFGELFTDSATVTIDCDDLVDEGSVDVGVDCTVAGGQLTLTNTADVDVYADVIVTDSDGNEVVDETVQIDANSEATIDANLDNGDYTVEVELLNGAVSIEQGVTVDCDDLVDVEVDCSVTGGELTIDSTAAVAVSATVYDSDGNVVEADVRIDANGEVTISGLEDGDYTVRIELLDGTLVEETTVTVDCDDLVDVEVDIEVDCVEADGELTFTNTNDVAVTVVVTGPDGYEQSVPIKPGTEQKLFDLPDGEYTVETIIDGEIVSQTTVTVDCDEPEEPDQDAFQADLAFGEPIEDIGEDENAFYGRQGRLIQAVSFLEDGTYTDTYRTPPEGKTAESVPGDCTVEYSAIEYDPATGEVSADVHLPADADCESVTVTLAAYELPDGTVEFQRDRADEQELVASQTIELSPGDSRTLTIDVDN